ncbi:hypothetical protein QQF64_029981 [Cirrhinus molitorella]|uniref:Uncharacterized protein n=1 Tax=Cirrhinus molitorella TaxID=172907 RepID=A0ABR3N215_9TELE
MQISYPVTVNQQTERHPRKCLAFCQEAPKTLRWRKGGGEEGNNAETEKEKKSKCSACGGEVSKPMTDSGPEKRLDFTIEAELGTTAGVRSAAGTLFSWRKEKTAMERKHAGMVFGSI